MSGSPEQFLFIRTARYGAEPDGFYEQLADDFAADLHLSDDVRRDYQVPEAEDYDVKKALDAAVGDVLDSRVEASLRAGHSVIHGGHLNERERRDKMRQIADDIGGIRVVSLLIRTPYDVIRDRLSPAEYRESMHMGHTLEVPGDDEAHLRLSGNADPPVLIRMIMDYIDA